MKLLSEYKFNKNFCNIFDAVCKGMPMNSINGTEHTFSHIEFCNKDLIFRMEPVSFPTNYWRLHELSSIDPGCIKAIELKLAAYYHSLKPKLSRLDMIEEEL